MGNYMVVHIRSTGHATGLRGACSVYKTSLFLFFRIKSVVRALGRRVPAFHAGGSLPRPDRRTAAPGGTGSAVLKSSRLCSSLQLLLVATASCRLHARRCLLVRRRRLAVRRLGVARRLGVCLALCRWLGRRRRLLRLGVQARLRGTARTRAPVGLRWRSGTCVGDGSGQACLSTQ